MRYEVCIPDTPEWRTQLWGAISLLLQNWQWEGDSPLSDEEISAEYQVVLNSFVRCPVIAGLVMAYGGSTPPDGNLLCDGASYSASSYPELFGAIGHTFGGSGGSFNVPDLRKKFPLGVGSGISLAETGGAESVVLTQGQMPRHDHALDMSAASGGGIEPVPLIIPNIIPFLSTDHAGNDEAHENMPPYIGLNYIISTGVSC